MCGGGEYSGSERVHNLSISSIMLQQRRITSIYLFPLFALFLISYAGHTYLPSQLSRSPSLVTMSIDISNTAPPQAFVDYDKFLLFGDSITQGSYGQSENGFSFGAALVNDYVRKLDVVNRGFSGYNTVHALVVLPQIIPPPIYSKIRLMTVFFGANDAVAERFVQHVPLKEYRRNLKRIIAYPLLTAHKPTIILIVPTPVCEYKMQEHMQLQRTANLTKEYADAAREVAKEVGVTAVDLWSIFMAYAGWHEGEPIIGSRSQPRSEKLDELLRDGLHPTSKGFEIMYNAVTKAIEQHHPELKPGVLPYLFPDWP